MRSQPAASGLLLAIVVADVGWLFYLRTVIRICKTCALDPTSHIYQCADLPACPISTAALGVSASRAQSISNAFASDSFLRLASALAATPSTEATVLNTGDAAGSCCSVTSSTTCSHSRTHGHTRARTHMLSQQPHGAVVKHRTGRHKGAHIVDTVAPRAEPCCQHVAAAARRHGLLLQGSTPPPGARCWMGSWMRRCVRSRATAGMDRLDRQEWNCCATHSRSL